MLYWVRSMGVRKSVTALTYLILMYLRVPHFSTYMWIMKSIHCQIIAMSTSILSHIWIQWPLIFLYIVVSSIILLAANSIHAIRFCTKKVTTKTDVVGCHVCQWPPSTNRNRSSIPFDCCVNACLPLLSSMGSPANMVVLRRVCVIPQL